MKKHKKTNEGKPQKETQKDETQVNTKGGTIRKHKETQ
jgi:hypothetical protein